MSSTVLQPGLDPSPLLRMVADLCADDAAVYLGVSPGALNSWRQGRRRVSWYNADRIAVHLGLHPVDLWPEWFDLAPEPIGTV